VKTRTRRALLRLRAVLGRVADQEIEQLMDADTATAGSRHGNGG
jgi:hypothetical protein